MSVDDAGAARLVIAGEPVAVRAGLRRLMASPALADLPADLRQEAELVLAEVLNNIAEHAYADGPGLIEVQVAAQGDGLACYVRDRGAPMPGGVPPSGGLPAATGPDLPEGGFGWHLIRTLTRDLSYARDRGGNRLTFRIGRS